MSIKVGKVGFEPTASWSQTTRANQTALLPDGFLIITDANIESQGNWIYAHSAYKKYIKAAFLQYYTLCGILMAYEIVQRMPFRA